MYTSPLTKKQRISGAPSFRSSPISIDFDTNSDSIINDGQAPDPYVTKRVIAAPQYSMSDVEFVKLKNEVSRLNNKISLMQVESDHVTAKNKALVVSLESKLYELTKERRILLESEIDLKAELDKRSLKKQDSKLVALLESKTQEILQLESELDEHKKRIGAIMSSGNGNNSPQVVIASDTETNSPSINESSVLEQISFLKAQYENLTSGAKANEHREVANRIVQLNLENSKLKADNEYLKKINTNRLMIEEKMHSFSKKMEEYEELKKKYAQLSSSVNNQSILFSSQDGNLLKELEQKIADLETQLEAKNVEFSHTKASYNFVKTENIEMKTRLSALSDNVDALKDEISILKKDYKVLEQDRNNLAEQLK